MFTGAFSNGFPWLNIAGMLVKHIKSKCRKSLQSEPITAEQDVCIYLIVIQICVGLSSTESVRKIIDKSPIKFVRGIKLDTKNGKTEERLLVS